MQGHYIKTKVIHVSIPETAHQQLQKLAAETSRTDLLASPPGGEKTQTDR